MVLRSAWIFITYEPHDQSCTDDMNERAVCDQTAHGKSIEY